MSDNDETNSGREDGSMGFGQYMSEDYLAESISNLIKISKLKEENRDLQAKLSQLEIANQELREENSSFEGKVSKLRSLNEKLIDEVGHLHWHIGVYHLTLEKFSKTTLPIYHEAFREYRDKNSECAQCMNARLLERINELENKVKIFEQNQSATVVQHYPEKRKHQD